MTNPYAPKPTSAPQLTPQEERSWSIGVHAVTGAAMVLSAGTLGFVAALVVYLMYKDRGPFIRHHAANALNIQLTALVWGVAVLVFGILTIGVGWLLFAVIPFVAGALHLLGALAASRGEWTTPPLTIRFVR
ncbi:hypothetical protein GCM10011584_16750 [Nocardioides phosphati]|uniref:DUF4870 domain-containing protein n=1 Tax=Nocardioides phosphati TaxID=1867775 RepID=A0ABQ2N9H7_9ACTN|nr:DUF4870 domain-containing protein [Nocardioides phosphati]GGO88824.1 hypothetical protein GCM10011584_16750 [Nocardioides phosphati]